MRFDPEELMAIPHVEIRNIEKLRGKKIVGVSTDSRSVREDELFIALQGENFDGNKFLGDAFANGCIAAIVDQTANLDAVRTMPLLVVENTTRAYADLARYHRQKFDIPVLAIGGSNGKTTTKEMVAAVLMTKYNVLRTEANHNNHIGVPQTLLQLEKKHDVAVIEIGTNHPGELRYLCDVVKPTHGLVTNIGREHLEFFRTLAGVAAEEGQLFQCLGARKGSIAFVNADDALVVAKSKYVRTKVTYSLKSKRASVYGKIEGTDASGRMTVQFSAKSAKRPTAVRLTVPGEHNAVNAIAAAAVGLTFKVSAKKIKSALEQFSPASKRMEVLHVEGVTIYNDTYNANPDSTIAAVRTLSSAELSGRKIAVLADMKELGEKSEIEHARVGKQISAMGIDTLLTFGDNAQNIHNAAIVSDKAHYTEKHLLVQHLLELVAEGDGVLVKGSRGMKMEDVVASLVDRLTTTGAGRLHAKVSL